MRCKSCHQEKDQSEFSFRKDTGKYRPDCKACRSHTQTSNCSNDPKCLERKRKDWARTKDRVNAKKRDNYDPKKKKAQHLKYLYGISLDDYNQMFAEQRGRCAVCGTHQSELRRALSVDHDHETGQIRGLLCDGCNLMLGQFEDKPDVLWRAALYINQYVGQSPARPEVEQMATAAPGMDGLVE